MGAGISCAHFTSIWYFLRIRLIITRRINKGTIQLDSAQIGVAPKVAKRVSYCGFLLLVAVCRYCG